MDERERERERERESKQMYLKFNTPVEAFPFLGSVLNLSVKYCNAGGVVQVGRSVRFHFVLQYTDEEKGPVVMDNAIEVSNKAPLVVSERTGKSPVIQVKLLPSVTSERDYVLTVFPIDSENSTVPISPYSTSFRPVIHRLEICNHQAVPTVWFKDEGGERNHIVLKIRLLDSRGSVVTTRGGVKLKCVLYFEDGEEIADQTILKISDDTNMFLGDDGLATIRFKISEVSQKHNRRKFYVVVKPDTVDNNNNRNISEPSTVNMLVKSKISTENRKKRMMKLEEKEKSDRATKKMLLETSGGGGKKRKSSETIGATSCGLPSKAKDMVSSEKYTTMLQCLSFTKRKLEFLKQQLKQSSTSVNPITVIDEILSFQNTINLPSGSHADTKKSFASFSTSHVVPTQQGAPNGVSIAPPKVTYPNNAKSIQPTASKHNTGVALPTSQNPKFVLGVEAERKESSFTTAAKHVEPVNLPPSSQTNFSTFLQPQRSGCVLTADDLDVAKLLAGKLMY